MRKQLFIVRTSGARLLALINDVMDAATLRQRRLVLKQERLQLRQVVGDVVDLTRSLVSMGAGGLCTPGRVQVVPSRCRWPKHYEHGVCGGQGGMCAPATC